MIIFLNYKKWTTSQGGGEGRYTLPPHTTKRRTTTNFKKPHTQPELTENRTVWKCDNQGIKEETFIQTGRRSGDGQLGQRRHVATWQMAEWVVPHLHAKKPGGTTREQDRPCNPGFQRREIKTQNL